MDFNHLQKRSNYRGTMDDGRWWDSLLATWALIDSGEDQERIGLSVDYMIKNAVQENGGIAYGYDFEYAPDSDDTALLVTVMSKLDKLGEKYK